MGENAYVEITKARNLFEARLIAGRLESEGIPARIPGDTRCLYDRLRENRHDGCRTAGQFRRQR